MKKKIFRFGLALILQMAPIDAQISGLQAAKEHILNQRQNYFITSAFYPVTSKVNPITGEYQELECDLVVTGAEPLSIKRFYNHFAPEDIRYGNWRYNPEAFLVANLEWSGQEVFASVGDRDGSVYFLQRSGSNFFTFNFTSPAYFTIHSDGKEHPLNISLEYSRLGDPKDKRRYQYIGKIKDGSGRIRCFSSAMHRWIDTVSWTGKLLKTEGKWRIGADAWTPYQMPIIEEKLPNGNIICYTYTYWKDEKQNYPLPRLLNKITAYNHNKTKILGFIELHYNKDHHKDVIGIECTGSDGRTTVAQFAKQAPYLLTSCMQTQVGKTLYQYHEGSLSCIERSQGPTLMTAYDPKTNKVSTQYAPVGPEGQLAVVAAYEYQDFATSIYDAENNKTTYRLDEDKKITAIEHYMEHQLYSVERFKWHPQTGSLMSKIVEDSSGQSVFEQHYEYDKNHNPILEKKGCGNCWQVIERRFSEDGFNLKVYEKDHTGKQTYYIYVTGTNLLASELEVDEGKILKRRFYFYDDCAVCVKKIIDDGHSRDFDDLKGVTYRKLTYITPKQHLPCLGLPEIIEEKTIDKTGCEISLGKTVYTYTPWGAIAKQECFDADGVYQYCVKNTYDAQEKLISQTDPLGYVTTFEYDKQGNLIQIIGPKANQHQQRVYDKANRLVKTIDYQEEGKPLITKRRYDKCGRVVEETDLCQVVTRFEYDLFNRLIATYYPDGSVEKTEYDALGHVIKYTDRLGGVTYKTYDPFGQILTIQYPDNRKEQFTYDGAGRICSCRKTDQTITYFSYDRWGHPSRSETYSLTGEQLQISSSKWSAFNLLMQTTDGIATTYDYDFIGRKIKQQQADQEIAYTYDALGRLQTIQNPGHTIIKEYDAMSHLIQEKVVVGRLVQKHTNYDYDALGKCIAHGTTRSSEKITYNFQQQPISIVDALGCATHIAYHYEDGLTKITTDPNGAQTHEIYDACYRLARHEKKDREGLTIFTYENSYDAFGNKIKQVHTVFHHTTPIDEKTYHWDYDFAGRLKHACEQLEQSYLYDELGHLKTIIKADGNAIHYLYDSLGYLLRVCGVDIDYQYYYDDYHRLICVKDAILQTATERRYDEKGRIIYEKLGNHLEFHKAYNSADQKTVLVLPDRSKIEYDYLGLYLYSVKRNDYQHIYHKRGLAGNLTEIKTPIGSIKMDQDLLYRVHTLIAPTYRALYSHDVKGNLIEHHYEDKQGVVLNKYTYNDLDQLITENEETYTYNSLSHRLKKGDDNYTVNAAGQILNDGHVSYSYDSCGNLTAEDNQLYTYDSLNRLITVQKENVCWRYCYDGFNRRLSESKFVHGELVHQLNYLWDDTEEIGAADKQGRIQQLRILGEEGAILYELNRRRYVPICDPYKSVVALIDLKTKQAIENYRYNSFGNLLTDNELSPWLFWGGRIDETGLLYLGVEGYYHTQLGMDLNHHLHFLTKHNAPEQKNTPDVELGTLWPVR